MPTMNPRPTKAREVFDTFIPPMSWIEVLVTKYGMILTSLAALVALIVFTAWMYLTYRPSIVLPPIINAPTSTPSIEDTDSLFAESDSRAELVVRPPILDASNNSNSTELTDDSLAQDEADNLSDIPTSEEANRMRYAESITPAANATTATAKSGNARSSIKTPYSSTPKSASRTATSKRGANPVPTSRNTNRRLDIENELLPPSSVTMRKSIPPDTRNADTLINTIATPRDFTSSATVAPAPEPLSKKTTRKNGGLVVIVNKANSNPVSKSDISNIYSDRITRWPSGERILILNLPLDSRERQRFSTAILDMSPQDAAKEWSNRTITNRSQSDYRTKNAQVVVSYVERHENAIGYVPATVLNENDNVRVVYSIP